MTQFGRLPTPILLLGLFAVAMILVGLILALFSETRLWGAPLIVIGSVASIMFALRARAFRMRELSRDE
jgi:hypothetical protein